MREYCRQEREREGCDGLVFLELRWVGRGGWGAGERDGVADGRREK